MAGQTPLTRELLEYMRQVSLREDELLRELRNVTELYPMGSAMQVMAEEGQLLGFLVSLISARHALEVGTFTGYSALCIGRALEANGRLITCDASSKWITVAEPYWEKAGLSKVIEPRIGDAKIVLNDLLAEVGSNYMDFVFIDADKPAYAEYYELGLQLLRPGGLMVLDNIFGFGHVSDATRSDPATIAMRSLAEKIHRDDRVDLTILPMADGITMVRKRAPADGNYTVPAASSA